ncbi:MFS transporter [Micromonospora cremea]|uniref:Na+/melibiose symporter n=1 Tax=Micromonospora cremea TaxID=709881 RepID=A0A1N5TE37_9ACTN|nr:MFS transporter [Micromonospora cremea]SIM46713.1 Na+/melibiose symporter [Micromonospora cremea]
MAALLLIAAAGLGHFGWGTILPYQYVYASETRGWGPLVGALASSLFSVGALAAAPMAGRLTDRRRPASILIAAQAVAACGSIGMLVANQAWAFCASSFIFGCGMTGASPAKSVLVLRWSSGADRRRVFAYRFTGESVGMALGALASGAFVDLSRPDGMTTSYVTACVALGLAMLVVAIAARTARDRSWRDEARAPSRVALRSAVKQIAVIRPLRWVAVITVSLSLAFYAQFEAGLPAYALSVLHVDEVMIGLGAAVNCATIVALQLVMLKLTANRQPGPLLMLVGGIWVLCWILLGLAPGWPAVSTLIFVSLYGVFAVGETIFAPLLNPLVAQLAPPAIVGTTLGAFAALQTTFSAVGPLVAGVLLGGGLPEAFVGLHLAISVIAVVAAWRLHRLLGMPPQQRRTRSEPRRPLPASPAFEPEVRRVEAPDPSGGRRAG